MRQSTLSIHSENILPIIKKWLYSDKDIFVRELVSNASDALNKAKILRDRGQIQAVDADFKISVTIDKGKKTIAIEDTGIGMTEEEVVQYIAQIAFSGAEEFVKKFQAQTAKDPIIGHFGLGFYSAYMVASRVELESLSFKAGAKPVVWSCDGSSTYSIGAGKRRERGTSLVLHVAEESQEYLEEAKLRELLNRYCRFFPFPIELNGRPLENRAPLWLKSSSECTDQEYLAFYRTLFPMAPDPMFWIHLNVDYPFHLQGILYFPKVQRRMEKEKGIQLFCNRVFVSDHCGEILPDFLTMLRGAIDSPDIPLNVSRSSLQVDKNVRQLTAHISKKVSDRLASLYRADRSGYLNAWEEIELIVKLGCLQDEKFYDRMKDALVWKNSAGEWTTVTEYVERNPGQKVFYATEEREGPLVQAYRDKKLEVLYAKSWIDTAVISFLEGKLSCQFQRIDGGALDEKLFDPSREKTLLDPQGKSEATRLADFIRRSLGQKEIEVEAKSLASDQLPGLLLLNEEQRRFRDYMAITQGASLPPLKKGTFVVNTNHKLVQAVRKLEFKAPEVAADLARHLFDLSRLSQKEVDPSEVDGVLARHTSILEKLVELIRG